MRVRRVMERRLRKVDHVGTRSVIEEAARSGGYDWC